MDIDDLLMAKRKEILQIVARYGARNVRLFGSAARGEASPDSDVDFLVELGPDSTLLGRAAMIRELESLLGRKVDVVSDRGLRQRVRERVLQEALPL